jgi:hypothetical protein
VGIKEAMEARSRDRHKKMGTNWGGSLADAAQLRLKTMRCRALRNHVP